MVKEAEANAETDREARELAEARNQLDALRLQAQRALEESEGVPEDQQTPVREAIETAEKAINDPNVTKDRYETLSQELAQACRPSSRPSRPQAPPARRTERKPRREPTRMLTMKRSSTPISNRPARAVHRDTVRGGGDLLRSCGVP